MTLNVPSLTTISGAVTFTQVGMQTISGWFPALTSIGGGGLNIDFAPALTSIVSLGAAGGVLARPCQRGQG